MNKRKTKLYHLFCFLFTSLSEILTMYESVEILDVIGNHHICLTFQMLGGKYSFLRCLISKKDFWKRINKKK
jgi:hypothetical protein